MNAAVRTMVGAEEPTKRKSGGALADLARRIFSGGAGPPAGGIAALTPSPLAPTNEATGKAFLAAIVGKLGTCFATPEEEVIFQNE